MRRLTDEELSEPDVWLKIPIERWTELPDAIQSELSYFLRQDKITALIFRLPAYRWREISESVH